MLPVARRLEDLHLRSSDLARTSERNAAEFEWIAEDHTPSIRVIRRPWAPEFIEKVKVVRGPKYGIDWSWQITPPIAASAPILVISGFPKTLSGKIMH